MDKQLVKEWAHKDIYDLASVWLAMDKNPDTRSDIQKLVDAKDTVELEKRLRKRIEFGTAGLRASMQAGFAKMNDLTGLAKYLLEAQPDAQKMGIVIGHDHRHHSEQFARLTAGVFLHAGFRVWFYRDYVHTPLVPYSVKVLKAAAGVMITASHNPKDDNGYKLYWNNACQIIPPIDAHVAAHIADNLTPWAWDEHIVDTDDKVIDPTTKGVIDAYFEELAKLSHYRDLNGKNDIKIVYTPMHGVGLPFMKHAFDAFRLPPFTVVDIQQKPDPDFPTVAFPNPEEGKGALKCAMDAADKVGANVIIANDPDADRLAVAERSEKQIGAIFGGAMVDRFVSSGKDMKNIAMLASTVSSKFLKAVAEHLGFHFAETLTGFKWLGNQAQKMRSEGLQPVFAFEEAIGFAIGGVVWDKDGVSAGVIMAEWIGELHRRKLTLHGYLESLYKQYGYFVTNNSYFICRDPVTIKHLFDHIRYGEDTSQRSLAYPTKIASHAVVAIRDLTIGYDSSTPDKKPILPVSADSQMITFRLENDVVFTIRTSGTEPKIKYYSEMKGSNEAETANELASIMERMGQELFAPEKNKLERPH